MFFFLFSLRWLGSVPLLVAVSPPSFGWAVSPPLLVGVKGWPLSPPPPPTSPFWVGRSSLPFLDSLFLVGRSSLPFVLAVSSLPPPFLVEGSLLPFLLAVSLHLLGWAVSPPFLVGVCPRALPPLWWLGVSPLLLHPSLVGWMVSLPLFVWAVSPPFLVDRPTFQAKDTSRPTRVRDTSQPTKRKQKEKHFKN